VLRPALSTLSSMPPEDIAAFEQILAAKLYALDTREHARWCYRRQSDPDNGDDYISSDDFLYSRCVVVANGREFFGDVLADPSKFPAEMEFESLLSLAGHAYEQRTGQPLEVGHDLSWESFSNTDGWRGDPDVRVTAAAVRPAPAPAAPGRSAGALARLLPESPDPLPGRAHRPPQPTAAPWSRHRLLCVARQPSRAYPDQHRPLRLHGRLRPGWIVLVTAGWLVWIMGVTVWWLILAPFRAR
jgi:Protein of unknown function (DUF4240)